MIVEIDGVAVSILNNTLKIERRIEARSTASFTVKDIAGTASFTRGMPIEIYDSVPNLIFSGFIDTPSMIRISPSGGLFHDIVCMDNHYLADKRLVVESYTGQTAGAIITDIHSIYLIEEGVTVGSIQTGPTINSAIFNHIKASAAFDAIKEASGSFIWFIDEDKKLYFVDRTTYNAPWNLDGTTHKPLEGSSRLSTGNPLHRNFQYIWGGTDETSLQTENFTGDGENRAFTLLYPLSKVPIVKEDTVTMTVGIKGIDTGKDYYWSKGDSVLAADTAPSNGVDVEVQYYGQYPYIAASVDGEDILSRATLEGSSGKVEEIIREAWHEDRDAARQSAQAKITQFCQDAEKYTYQTYDGGLAPGQMQDVTYSPFGFSAHAMLIESVSVMTQEDEMLYTIVCITGPIMGDWTLLFTNMLTRQDKSIRVGGDLLLKLLIRPESLSMAETPAIRSEDFSGGLVNIWIAIPPSKSHGHNVQHEAMDLAEALAIDSHDTEDYLWDDSDAIWDFATWA